MELNKGLTC